MTFTRRTSLLLLALAAAACGEARGPATDASTVTMPNPDGSTVTVEVRFCVTCHGDAANATNATTDAAGIQFAPPKDLAGATTGAKVGAHMAHLRASALRGEGVPCSSCHVIPPNATQHTPGVAFRGLASTVWSGAPAIAPDWNVTAPGGCTSTYCHGAFPGGLDSTPTWTGTASQVSCGSCHDLPPALPHPQNNACATCHPGYTSSTVNLALHMNGQRDGGCNGCHGDSTNTRTAGNGTPIPGATYDSNLVASPPVDHTGSSTSVIVGAHLAHVNPTPSTAAGAQPTGGVYKPILCSECHPSATAPTHQNGSPDVTFATATAANLDSYVPSETPSSGATAATCSTYCHDGVGGGSVGTWSWNGTGANCGSCHGFPPASHDPSLTTAAQCSGCHSGTVNADGTINIAGGLHIDGIVEGGESTGGQACGDCHSVILSGMTSAATSQHALTLDTAVDSAIAWTGATLSGVPAASRSCVDMCHGDHPHDLTSPVVATHEYNVYVDASTQASRAAGTRTDATRAKTDFDGAAASGGLCISCHDTPISAGGPTISAAAFGASAHDFTAFTAGATWTWQYVLHSGAFDRNCTKCHASATEGTTPSAPATGSSTTAVHFNTNPSLLAGTATPIAAGLVCFNCHGSAAPVDGSQGDRSGVDVQAEFVKASSHAVAGVDCMSCHDPHKAKAGDHATPGNLAGPPIEGAAGAVLASANYPAFWTAPAAGAFSATTIVSGTDLEATLCFKCHTAFAGTLPAGTTDVAKEFNPNNVGNFAGTWAAGETAGGFHPVLASAGANLGAVKLTNLVTTNHAWSTTARNTMTCTDCHGSDNVTDPNGPHGSAANFILKGPNTTWSASVLLGSSIPAGTFCLNCHQSTFTNSRFTGHSRSDHTGMPCFNCHAAVPHGGPRPGMLVAGAGANANVGGTIAGWDTTSPYWQGTGTDRLYLVSYPTTNTAGWSQNNCGCNGTGH